MRPHELEYTFSRRRAKNPSVLLLEVFCRPSMDYICRQVHRQLMRNELARFYHYRTRKCLPPNKLRRDIQ